LSEIKNTVNVPQKNLAENPNTCIEVSFVFRKVIRGHGGNLRILVVPTRSSLETTLVMQVSGFRETTRPLNISGEILTSLKVPSLVLKIKEMGMLKSQGTVIEKSNVIRRLIGSTTSSRTGVKAVRFTIVNLLGTVFFKLMIELLDADGIASDYGIARV
jgi:hypothetical protein